MRNDDSIYTLTKEQEIRTSNLVSLLMPQTSSVAIGVKGLDGRYQLVNNAMEGLLGRSTEEIVGMVDKDLFPRQIAAQLQHSDEQIADGGAAASDQLDFSVNGIPVRCLSFSFPLFGADGKISSFGTVIFDTAQNDAFEEIRQNLKLLQQTNQELEKGLAKLEQLASTDKLTGAWNRRRLEEASVSEMDRLNRYNHPLSLLIFDIDFFKHINDAHGHATGDQVLVELSAVVRATLRASDSLTRWGGEEFVILSPNTTLSTMAMLAERLRERIATTDFEPVKRISVSIGVAECISGETWGNWFKRADAALYRAKACGRNQVQIAPETPQRVGAGENVGANFVQLAWHSSYECGNSVIDNQHRSLFGDANNLLTAILNGHPTDEVAALIDVLIRDVVQHFKDEEALFKAAGYPGAAEHAAIHSRLVDSAIALVGRFHAGTLAIGEVFQFLAHDVVAQHMLGTDREFFPYLETRR